MTDVVEDPRIEVIADQALAQTTDLMALAESLKNEALGQLGNMLSTAQQLAGTLTGLLYTEDDTASFDWSAPEFPEEPDLAEENPPEVPELDELNDAPTYTEWTGSPYTEMLKTAIKNLLTSVLGGSAYISDAIYDAIFLRAAQALTKQQTADEWKATNMGAQLGWKLPSEVTLMRLAEVQDQTSEKQAMLRLEQAIAEAVQKREDMRAAVVDGTAFEKSWIDKWNAEESRSLEAAKANVEIANQINKLIIESNDLKIRSYTSQWQAIQTKYAAIAAIYEVRMKQPQILVSAGQVLQGFAAADSDHGIRIADGRAKMTVDANTAAANVVMQALTALTHTMAGMAQAAMSAADISVSAGASFGSSSQTQTSNSTSTSTDTNYNYSM